ncbi:MAG: T9SS type A sorting domain-containing protein [bacterium]
MRHLFFILSFVMITLLAVSPSFSTQYLNRVLITCEPLQYEIQPLEIYGGGLLLDRNFHNDYGDCTMEAPGPPFVIEMPVIIDNIYNPDGTVAQGCSFLADNRFGGGDPFEIYIQDEGYLKVNGELVAEGKPGDPVIFKNSGGFFNNFDGGPSNQSPYEYTYEFTWCEIRANGYLSSSTLEMRGGHLLMNNCTFGGTVDQHCLDYSALRDNVWDITFNNCTFSGVSHPTRSPVWLVGIRSLDLNNAVFNSCDYETSSPAAGVMEIGGNFILKNLNGISGSGNSRNWVYLNAAVIQIEDSCTIKTSNNFTAYIADNVIVDTNATLTCDKGTVLQMNNGAESKIIVRGKMVMDSTVITSFADRNNGVVVDSWSTDDPDQALSWKGIDVEIGGELEINNHSLIRWADGPIVGDGNIKIDHSTIEQGWGSAINMHYTSPSRLELSGANVHQMYGLGEGIDFTMSINSADSASGEIIIDSSVITQCGGYGVYLGGGVGRPLDDSLSVRITNSVISGNGGSGIYGFMGQPADSIIILNNQFIGNGAHGLWLDDNGCDSMCVRLENNVALGNNGTGLGIKTGFADVIGNTSAYNESYGLYYPYKPRRLGHVVNNIFANNDYYGLYCYAKYGGTVPGISHNIFWQNADTDNELYINSDDFNISTVAELQALGGVGTTNEELEPMFRPVYRDRILVHYYDSALVQSRMWVDGDNLEAGQLDGLAILPSQHDTTAWYYVLRNTSDSIFIAGDIRPTTNSYDTLTVYNFHLTSQSPAIEFGDSSYVKVEYDIDGDNRILDADENGSVLVDAGADEYNPDTTNIQIYVLNPKTDTVLIADKQVVISWAVNGLVNISIDYAIDIKDGELPQWQTLTTSVPVAPNVYPWTVPDTFSYHTKIRIRDAGSSGYQTESGYFHIKPPYLTRVKPDSSYERYLPSLYSWQLPNDSANIWPDTWFNQFDYMNGTDPYTNEQYPGFDTAYPFALAEAKMFPDWPLYASVFTEEECYHNTLHGLMYNLRAVNFWDIVSDNWNGSCAGLSTTSLLSFIDHAEIQALWPDFTIPDILHNQTINSNSRLFINNYQIHQFGRAERENIASKDALTPKETLGQLNKMLLGDPDSVACLGIGCQPGNCWHAMAPYAIAPHADWSRVSIRVYDPNRPGQDTATVMVDTVTNSWWYSGFPSWGGPKNLILIYPARYTLDDPEFKKSALKLSSINNDRSDNNPLQLIFGRTGDVMVYNSTGDSTGFDESGVVNMITEACSYIAFEGENAPPYGFGLPDDSLNVVVSNFHNDRVSFGAFYDSLFFGYSRNGAESTETDQLVINQNMIFANPDATTKAVKFRAITTLADKERSLTIDSISVGNSDSIMIQPLDSTGWCLSNRAVATQYNLWIREVSNEGEKIFYAIRVPIGDNQSHILTPDWNDFQDDSIMIFIDYDFDMVIDDSVIVHGDFLLDVDDEHGSILPYKFELSQNYPNPFNPITTISYSLPRKSDVLIEIFNILGQKIVTLINETKPAGEYQINWDGDDSNGHEVSTGIYLYRFNAGDYSETKKMILLK